MTSVLPKRLIEDRELPSLVEEPLSVVPAAELTTDAADGSEEIDDGVVDDGPSGVRPATPVAEELTDRQRQILVFERKWWRHAGSKEQAIREQFDLSATRYYQMLNKLLDFPAALEYDPLVVGRLRRLRATRSRVRSTR